MKKTNFINLMVSDRLWAFIHGETRKNITARKDCIFWNTKGFL